MTRRIVLEGGYVATVDAAGTEHTTGHVVIEDGRIAAVGAGPRPRRRPRRRRDLRRVGMPGHTGAHQHAPPPVSVADARVCAGRHPLRLADSALPVVVADRRAAHRHRRRRRDGCACPLGLHDGRRPPLHLPEGVGRHRRRDRRGVPTHRRAPARDAGVDGPRRLAGRTAARLRGRDDGCRPLSVGGGRGALPRSVVRVTRPGRHRPVLAVLGHRRPAPRFGRCSRARSTYGCTPTPPRRWRRTPTASSGSAAPPPQYLESLGWLGSDVWMAHCVHLDEARSRDTPRPAPASRTARPPTRASPRASRRSATCCVPGFRWASASTAPPRTSRASSAARSARRC